MNDSNFEELTAEELVGVGGGRGGCHRRCRPRPCNDPMNNQTQQMPPPMTTPAPPPVTITISMNPAAPTDPAGPAYT